MVATYAHINLFDRNLKVKRLRKGISDFDYKGKTYVIDPDAIMFEEKAYWWSLFLVPVTKRILTYIEDTPKPLSLPRMESVERMGIPPVELQKIFTPKFYEIIARSNNKTMQYLLFGIVGSVALNLYLVYQMSKLLTAIDLLKQAAGIP